MIFFTTFYSISRMEQAKQIHITCLEMMTQRGYTVTKDTPEIILARKDTSEIVIFVTPLPKLNIEQVQRCISSMNELKLNHCIIIYSGVATPAAKKIVENGGDFKIELFMDSELMYNITKHRFACEHVRLSKADSIAFKKTYGAKHPMILTSDAVSRFYDFAKGDIIMIRRNGGYVAWRIVR